MGLQRQRILRLAPFPGKQTPPNSTTNRASLDGSDIVGALFAAGRHTAQPDRRGFRSHLTEISCE